MTCVSNEVGGGLVGNAVWLGTPLEALLDEAGIQKGADQIVGRAFDGFTTGFPVDNLDGRPRALLAVGMNGEPLPLAHGFPARIIVPGLYGFVSATKWLTEIELTTFADFDQYWVKRDWSDRRPDQDHVPHRHPQAAWARSTAGKVADRRRGLGPDPWHRARSRSRSTTASGPRPSSADEDYARSPGASGSTSGTPPPGRHTVTVPGHRHHRRGADRGAGRALPQRGLRLAQHRGARQAA